jgi:hypothetical protein
MLAYGSLIFFFFNFRLSETDALLVMCCHCFSHMYHVLIVGAIFDDGVDFF